MPVARVSCLLIGLLVGVAIDPSPAAADGWLNRLSGRRALAALQSGTPAERRTAARTLGRVGAGVPVVRALRDSLQRERDSATREAIFESLTRRNDSEAIPLLIEELHRHGGAPVARVAWFLGAFATTGALGALIAALEEDSLREAVTGALVRAGSRAVAPLVRAVPQPVLRPHAVELLGRLRDPRATGPLVNALDDERTRVQVAVLLALAEIGDPRAEPFVAPFVRDHALEVRLAAYEALAAVGSSRNRDVVMSGLGDSESRVESVAVAALCAIDPSGAVDYLQRTYESADSMPGSLRNDLLGQRHPAFAPVLTQLARREEDGLSAITQLAELEGGAGLAALEQIATGASGDTLRHAHTAIAIAMRRWRDAVPPNVAGEAMHRLREFGDISLLALAGDPLVEERLVELLQDESPLHRRLAADGLAALDTGAVALADALPREVDPEAFRSIARALVAQRHPVRLGPLRRWLSISDTMPEALALAAVAVRDPSSSDATSVARIRRAFREGLSHSVPRVRAGAARALSIAGDRDAWPGLSELLEDPMPDVRRAAGRALGALQVRQAHDALEGRWRVEAIPRVANVLHDALRSLHRRPPDPIGDAGSHVLWLRLVPAAGLEESEVERPIEAILDDGRWILSRTSPNGEWLVPDLPYAPVNVQVGLRRQTLPEAVAFQPGANAAR